MRGLQAIKTLCYFLGIPGTDVVDNVFGTGKAPIERYNAQTNPFLDANASRDQAYADKTRNTAQGRASQSYQQSFMDRNRMNQAGANLNNQAAGYNPLIDQLAQMSMGQGPSLANMQLQQGLNHNIASQYGMAAGTHGNPALASRLAAQNIAGLGQQTAFDSAQTRMQEQMNAIQNQIAARQGQSGTTGMAANLFGNIRNQDIGMNAQQSQIAQNSFMAALDDQYRREQLGLQAVQGFNNNNVSSFNDQQKRQGDFMSKLGSAAASGGGKPPI